MEEKTPEELMAECLLKGGKMLAKACSACGAPLFEYRGETRCVVCNPVDAPGAAKQVLPAPAALHEEERRISDAPAPISGPVAEELSRTLIALCRRVREESDAGECTELMNCISTGVDALRRLFIP